MAARTEIPILDALPVEILLITLLYMFWVCATTVLEWIPIKVAVLVLAIIIFEKLLLKIMSAASINKRVLLMSSEQKKIKNEINNIREDRYEKQLLKYYDFGTRMSLFLESKNLSVEKM